MFDILCVYIRIAKLLTLISCALIEYYCKKGINYVFKIPTTRLLLIQKLADKLERENIVYVKIFQALCLDKNILNSDENEFLLKYTDNVPYNINEIEYELLDKLHNEFSITLTSSIPINCGIVGLVFDGIDASNNKVIFKMLKKNILQRFTNVFDEMLYISHITSCIPYIKSLKITKLLLDNEQILLDQMSFIKEVESIEIFSKKYKNNKEYRFPKVYREITEKYDKLLVMENIRGLKFKDIANMSESIKEELSYILNKFGILGILYHSVIHCDIHSGNVFFYINDDDTISINTLIPKYAIGIIDFGICCYPNKENQHSYYIFFSEIHHNQNYSNIEQVIYTIVEEKEALSSFNINKKQQFINEVIDCLKLNTKDEITSQLLIDLSKLLNKYDLNFTKEFNKLIISLHTANSFGRQLVKNIKSNQARVIRDLNKCNELLYIK